MVSTVRTNRSERLESNRTIKQNYLLIRGVRRLYCGSGDIQGKSVEIEGEAAQGVNCNDCDGQRYDIYALVGVEDLLGLNP